jgi:hypothetical protein
MLSMLQIVVYLIVGFIVMGLLIYFSESDVDMNDEEIAMYLLGTLVWPLVAMGKGYQLVAQRGVERRGRLREAQTKALHDQRVVDTWLAEKK